MRRTPKAKNQLLTRTTHIARTDWSDVKMFDIVLITAKTMSACMLHPRRHPRPATHVMTIIYPHASYGSKMSSSDEEKTRQFRVFTVCSAELLQSVQYVWQLCATPVHCVETAKLIDRSSDFSHAMSGGWGDYGNHIVPDLLHFRRHRFAPGGEAALWPSEEGEMEERSDLIPAVTDRSPV